MKNSDIFIVAILILFFLFSQSCKKTNENEFELCGSCSNTEISGDYSGSGQYFTDDDPLKTESVDVKLSLESTDTDFFNIDIEVPEKFSKSYFAARNEDGAAISISGTTKSINLTIYKNENEYQINGTAKVYHSRSDTLFLDHSVSFTVFKK
jgi:hypothetical protein